jgi:hypothetical protein
LSGEICSVSEKCSSIGGTEITSDLEYGETCCVEGRCVPDTTGENGETPGTSGTPSSECDASGGTCRPTSCDSGEEINPDLSCSMSEDTCCIPKQSGGGNYTWVWILLILIIIVVLGIVFREKLRLMWLKMSSGKSKGTSSNSGPSSYPPFSPPPRFFPSGPTSMQRRPMPSQQSSRPAGQQPIQRRPAPISRPSGAQKELDDVLKKLKDMGK